MRTELKNLARLFLTIIFVCSLGFTLYNLTKLWRNPTVSILAQRSNDQLTAEIDRQLAIRSSESSIEARIFELLQDQPRNWIAIESIELIASDRGVELSSDLMDLRNQAYEDDHGYWKATGKCVSCALNADTCEISAVLLCRAPIELSPIGDVSSVIRESSNYVSGSHVDLFDLGLSAIGLASTAAILLSGGTSGTIKIGTAVAKTANRMGRISEPMMSLVKKQALRSIDWNIIANSSIGSYSSDFSRAINFKEIEPLLLVVDRLGSMRKTMGLPATLYLLKSVDGPKDALAFKRLADVKKDRAVGVFELIGKNNVVRSSMRYSDEALGAIFGIIGMVLSIASSIASVFFSFVSQRFRKWANTK